MALVGSTLYPTNFISTDARAHSLLSYKSTSFAEIQAFSEISLHIARESEMHVEVSANVYTSALLYLPTYCFIKFCKSFGVSRETLQNAQESPANSAYSQYILDIGVQGDVTELLVAVFSCLLGYGEVGLYLKRKLEDGSGEVVLEGNRYQRWIQDYSGADFQAAVNRGIRKYLSASYLATRF